VNVACDNCETGKYKETAGVNTGCDACEAGKYKASAGVNTGCDPCEAGKFSGSTASNGCTSCPAGKYSATGATTCAPCPAGASSPAGSSVCLQTYQIAHTPPEYNSRYAFAGVMQEGGVDWFAPDRQGSQYDGSGDPSFYFVLDLGVSRTVAKLVIRNHWGSGGHYTTKTFSISMSIDSSTNDFGPQVTGTLAGQESSLQDVQVGLTSRYLKFKVLTYGHYSAALKYVAVVVSV
jgi:hypothetical protein